MKKITLLIFAIIFVTGQVFSQKDITISREFKLFTNKNAYGYTKPLFTTLGQSFNTSLMNTAYVVNDWSFGLDISAMGMFIPKDQLTFDAELPNLFGNEAVTDIAYYKDGVLVRNKNVGQSIIQPTIYGNISTPVFASPQNGAYPDSMYKTVTYMEGNDIAFMSGLPVLQLVVGMPTRTQVRLRFLTAPIDESSLYYLNIGVNQNLDRVFELFKENSPQSVSLTAAYAMVTRNAGIDINSLGLGLNYSYKTNLGITFFAGAMFESLTGNFKAVRDTVGSNGKIVDSPFQEIRDGNNLTFDINSFTNYRLTGGFSFEIGPIEFHFDAAYASQPQINFGGTIWFFKPDEFQFKLQPIYPPDLKTNKLNFARELFTPEIPIQTASLTAHKERVFNLNADVKAYGKYQEIEYPLEKIKIEEFASRQMRPLMPYIFFDDNSSEIPQRYIVYNTSNDAQNFKYSSLVGKSTIETYYQMLNIYGKRMADNPNEKIILSGYKSNQGKEKKNKAISKQRAEKIRDYFVNVWKIESSRIKIESGNLPKKASNDKDPLGAEENRRVEIFVDNWETMKPIQLDDTLRKITPEKIILKPTATADRGIANYQMKINNNFATMKDFAGTGSPSGEFVWDFANDPRTPKLKNDLTYYIEVKDKDGSTYATDPKTLKLELLSIEEKRKNATKDTIINVYNLILFDFNKSTLDPTNKRITDIIKSEIPENAIVKVTGYTDMIGKEDYNLKLSTARAKSTADALNFKNTTYTGKGEYELLFDNSSPEGRYYCRTVVVEVRIPVN
ncbi:MAG TPA: OmpA family protein [Candidatus Kapabacteria bacterium]|nr:OmpA family protein [Candidatus Kapabacteria bacterium]